MPLATVSEAGWVTTTRGLAGGAVATMVKEVNDPKMTAKSDPGTVVSSKVVYV